MARVQPKYIFSGQDVIERYKIDEIDLCGRDSCGDCGALPGEYHYMNCDLERCPICDMQLLMCECWDGYAEEEK